MFGFIKISPQVGPTAPRNETSKRGLSLAVREAIAFAVLVAILVLGIGVRLWIYLPRGLLQ